MRKRFSILVFMIAVILLGTFTYYSVSKDHNKKTDTVIIDKDGKVIEPLKGKNNNFGH